MRRLIVLVLLLIPITVTAKTTHSGFHTASELRDWCQQKSKNYLQKKKRHPFNWTSSWWMEGNTFQVKGEWRTESNKVEVSCHAKKGVKKSQAVMEIGANP